MPATPDWSAGDVVAHLAEGDRAALATLQGQWELGGSIDEWAAAGVAAHRDEGAEARLEGWEAAADALRWHLAALDAEGWRGRVPWVAGTISVKTLGVLRLNDAWHHGRDLADATGRRFEADAPTLAFLADLAARTIPGGLSRRGRARPGAVILLRLGAGRWLLGGALGSVPTPAPPPTWSWRPTRWPLSCAPPAAPPPTPGTPKATRPWPPISPRPSVRSADAAVPARRR